MELSGKKRKKIKVIVGLSGGVDSSVAAYLLQQQGYEVEGLFMINWKDSSVTLSGDCSWEEDLIVAQLVARKLDIPLHVTDTSELYKKRVVDYMFREYGRGRTPNPDVLCNREIKFDVFIQKAIELNADFFATGHYCRKDAVEEDGGTVFRLLAGTDPGKDQSYFLCQLNQEQLRSALFPVGHLLKSEVRHIATSAGLASADRRDSQGICFVGKVDLPTFLQQKLLPRKGDIIEIPAGNAGSGADKEIEHSTDHPDLSGMCAGRTFYPDQGIKVGEHNGAWYFTIGQRRGLNVGGKPDPLFVIGIDAAQNVVYVGQGENHPGLFRKGLLVKKDEIHWINPRMEMRCSDRMVVHARVRYRQPLQPANLYMRQEGLYVVFDQPQRGITPGQFAAWYSGDELIGSGVIDA